MAAATTSDIRAWAQANGYDVGDRGRLPVEVTDAYNKDKGKGTKVSSAKPAPAKTATAKKAAPAGKAPSKVAKASAAKAAPVATTAPDATKASVTAEPAKPVVKAVVAATPAVVVQAELPTVASVEERVNVLEQQVAFLKGKLDKLEAAPVKKGFGRRK